YNALRLVRATHPEPVQTLTLADRLVSRAPDITRMLDKLDERGLIIRERPAENRRVVLVGITAAGPTLLQEGSGPLRDCHRRQLGHMAQADLKELVRLLHAARLPHEDKKSPWR